MGKNRKEARRMRKQRRYSIDKRITGFFLGLFIVAAGLATYYFFSFANAYYDNGPGSRKIP